MLPIIFVLGPSGVGKSYLSEGLEQDYSFMRLPIDTDDKKKSFEANGFPSEWDKDVHKVDPAHLVSVVRGRLAVEHAGAVISFPTVHVFTPEKLVEAAQLGVTPVVLWGKQEDCVRAAEKRIKKKGMTFNLTRYMRLNGPTFEAYALPEYADFRVEAFRPGGDRWPRGEWLAAIMSRAAG